MQLRRSERTYWWVIEHLLSLLTGRYSDSALQADFWWGDQDLWSVKDKHIIRYHFWKLFSVNFLSSFVQIVLPVSLVGIFLIRIFVAKAGDAWDFYYLAFISLLFTATIGSAILMGIVTYYEVHKINKIKADATKGVDSK